MKKTTVLIAMLAMSAIMFAGCGKSEKTSNNNLTAGAVTMPATNPDEATEAPTEKATEAPTEAVINPTTEESTKPAGDVKVATLDDIKHKDFEYGITSNAGAAKKIKIVQIESNTDTYCIAIENPLDDDIKVSFLREDYTGYNVGVYAHQIRVINTNLPKSSPFPHHNITEVSKMQENQMVLDLFTTTLRRGSGNDLIVEFEATKNGDKLFGTMSYNLVKDGVVYFPAVDCKIKSEGSISLRFNKPSSTTYKNDANYDSVVVQYSGFDKSVV